MGVFGERKIMNALLRKKKLFVEVVSRHSNTKKTKNTHSDQSNEYPFHYDPIENTEGGLEVRLKRLK